jgi:hypothetical protein
MTKAVMVELATKTLTVARESRHPQIKKESRSHEEEEGKWVIGS